MSKTAVYDTTVTWKGEHWGHIVMGNGPEMDFSAPPDAQGHAGVFTPEDAFVASVNTCIMMMFIWAAERFKLNLLSYECRAEGTSRWRGRNYTLSLRLSDDYLATTGCLADPVDGHARSGGGQDRRPSYRFCAGLMATAFMAAASPD